jgi:hypothetical protein
MENWFRLIETFRFFGEVPFIGNLRCLQQWFGMDNLPPASVPIPAPATQTQAIYLLGGPTAPQSQALIHRLHALGAEALTSTLSRETVWVNGRSLLWWAAPDAKLDLTQVISILQKTAARHTFPICQFQQGTAAELAEVWGSVDDGVMGGVSTSGLRQRADHAQFTGQVSTQNSGGFVSVRTRNFETPYDLSEWQGLRLQVRGDGQRYKLILRDRAAWDGAAYCGSFDTVRGEWQAVEVPFDQFIATFRARTIPNAPTLNSAQICAFQLMLSKFEYDGQLNPHFQPGAFALDIRDISVYQPARVPPLIAISSEATAQRYGTMLATSGLRHQVVRLEPGDIMDAAWAEALLSTIDALQPA